MTTNAKRKRMAVSQILSAANNDFQSSLYKVLFPNWILENLVFSGNSLHSVMSMVCQGSKGDTTAEIIRSLCYDPMTTDNHVIAQVYGGGGSSFPTWVKDNPGLITLLAVNRIYSQVGFDFRKGYFEDYVEQLNFSTPEKCLEAAGSINKFVAEKTNDKIQNLVDDERDLGPKTSLVIVSAIYFKCLWETEFQTWNTEKGKFYVTPSQTVDADMMSMKKEVFAYRNLKNWNARAIVLPFRGDRLVMIIVLPNEKDGLSKLGGNIESLLEEAKTPMPEMKNHVRIDLVLPRFRIETTLNNLEMGLKEMGMSKIFAGATADFSGMCSDEHKDADIHVSKVFHKAVIEVDEGAPTTAAAALAAAKWPRKLGRYRHTRRKRNISFVVDHPFIFQIIDCLSDNMVLFTAHCNDPTRH